MYSFLTCQCNIDQQLEELANRFSFKLTSFQGEAYKDLWTVIAKDWEDKGDEEIVVSELLKLKDNSQHP